MSKELENDSLVALRLGHLHMVQGVIGRLAGYSATVKNFTITIATATVALTLAGSEETGKVAILSIAFAAVALLALLDTYYLALERGFRNLHNEIATRPLAEAADLAIRRGRLDGLRTVRSFSVWAFYGPQLIVVAVLLLYN